MDASCLELTEAGRLVGLELADARRRWLAGDGTFWVQLREASRSEVDTVLGELGVGGLLRRRMLRTGKETSIIAVRDAVFAEWAVFADEACTQRAYVAALAVKNLLVTTESEPIEVPPEALQSLDLSELGPLSTGSVLCAMLLWHGSRTAHAARTLREGLLEIDKRMDEDPGSVDGDELARLKGALAITEAVAVEQDEAFAVLSEAQSNALDLSGVRGPMALLTSSASATRRLDDRLDRRFLELRHRASEHRQDLLNRRLAFLTVISTIFLPLTLLAGIWGMNFENMPELQSPFGYPVALGLMALVGAGVFSVLA
jgi:hypothetical protein